MTGLQHTTSSSNLLSTDIDDIEKSKGAFSSSSSSSSPSPSSTSGSGSGPKELGDPDSDSVMIDPQDPSSSTSTSTSSSSSASTSTSTSTPTSISQSTSKPEQGEESKEAEGTDDVVMNENEDILDHENDNDNQLQQDSGMEEIPDGRNADDSNGDIEAGSNQEGKRVKVYELHDTSWHDRGTGFCRGIYDDRQDIALIVVEPEDFEQEGGKVEGEGGFLKNGLLLSARVEKEDIYGKQQDTLIVWTEPATGLDMALSFQDPEGCEDIWQFICEVQRHLLNVAADAEAHQQVPSSSSPVANSPMLGPTSSAMQLSDSRMPWQVPTLANIRDQEMFIRMQAKSPVGRERAVEHILGEDYIKHLIVVLEQAEDLESLDDLHILCSLMQTILLFNDNGIFEYILLDEIFEGVMGMLEYDPEFPGLKASYRQYFKDTARFKQVVEIRDENIRQKIHQTYRLLYLKDVVLARLLDDPTFNILNGFVFFNQVDIINHIQSNDPLLTQLFNGFHEPPPLDQDIEKIKDEPLDERKRDVVMFLHQLMIMGKGVQLPSRLALYRNLVERGLLFVCEWSFRRKEPHILHAGAEILTLAVEHDSNVVRMHVLKEDEVKRRTLIMEIIGLLHSTKNLGLMSQMSDTLKTLLESPPENEAFVARTKEGPVTENFSTMFYETSANNLFKPLLEAPDIKAELTKSPKFRLTREHITLLQLLVELLSFCVLNHTHKGSYFILSNPISKKVVNLLYVKDKPLRHAALRYIRACLKTPNHFIHRYYVKNDLFLPLLELLEEETTRDNMMSSACMDVLELIRRDNLKTIINYLFDTYRERIEQLTSRAFLRKYILGLRNRWEINNEPQPPVQQPTLGEGESSKSQVKNRSTTEEEDYFNASDEEEVTPTSKVSPVTETIPLKRKRMLTHGGGPGSKKRPSGARQQQASSSSSPSTATTNSGPSTPGSASGGGALGLDYDDGSDSDNSSSGNQSPRQSQRLQQQHHSNQLLSETPITSDIKPTEVLEEDLGDVQLRMRAKRQREEEEEEGFAGLLVGANSTTSNTNSNTNSSDRPPSIIPKIELKKDGAGDQNAKDSSSSDTNTKKNSSTPVKDMGKKIRLNLGFGKKLGGGK
ncbi:uncharacterized protein IL334_000433 [Kwoniella shivajii]|uniref:Serine/threonine-protein phosphatase 4 regulatory subunit 3-like central domain-containing protein n=1 Tax=Kwoniella shivajii TaxID=564305 RepID=A0ABZ1CPC1_9TREE|nr:hypothetical protein IL334_000433 [Kwoniella shivajii]